MSLFVAVFAGWAMVVDDPFGGEPVVVVRTDLSAANAGKKPEAASPRAPSQAVNERPSRHDGAAVETAPPNAPGSKTVTIIDGTSGKRQEVVIPGPATDNAPGGVEQRLAETSRHGPLPKVAPDGSRPSEIYARAVTAIPGKPDAPRVAIVVGGLGISATATSAALSKLPGVVTLAFAPYGNNVDQLAARARADGHEVVLQVPMEPFDYPDNDPGPKTLLTTLDAGQISTACNGS